MNHTDITSITIVGLNTTHSAHQQYVNNIITLTRNLMTQKSQGTSSPTLQMTSPFMAGQTPFIITVPAPVVNINTPLVIPSGQNWNIPYKTSGEFFILHSNDKSKIFSFLIKLTVYILHATHQQEVLEVLAVKHHLKAIIQI